MKYRKLKWISVKYGNPEPDSEKLWFVFCGYRSVAYKTKDGWEFKDKNESAEITHWLDISTDPIEKECTKCKTIKSVDKFHNCSTCVDGLGKECKECTNARQRKRDMAIKKKRKSNILMEQSQ